MIKIAQGLIYDVKTEIWNKQNRAETDSISCDGFRSYSDNIIKK